MDSSRRRFLAGTVGLAALKYPEGPAGPSDAGLRYVTLGKTGLKATRLIFGTATLEEPTVIARALDMGINFVDTSRDYDDGNNERLVAEGIGDRRNRIILSSKTVDVNLPGQAAAPLETVAGALKELDKSLKELRTDHLDIWYLHHKDKPEWITDNLLEAARRAKQQGKTRFAGVSTHRVIATADRIIQSGVFDVVMATYNFTMDAAVGAAIEKLHKAGLGVIAFKCAAGGPRGKVRQMKRPGAMLASYRWALRNPAVHAVESNIENVDQLEENFACMATGYSAGDDKLLAARLEQIGPYQCRMCGGCEGQCAKGLPVEHILRSLMYAEGYGHFGMGRSTYLRLSEDMQAAACRDCEECTVACRHGVRVSQEVARAQQLFC